MRRQPLWFYALVFWLGYVVLMVTVPQWWPADPTLPNAAAALGYDTNKAFLSQALWTAGGLLFFGVAFQQGVFERTSSLPRIEAKRMSSGRTIEIVGIFVLFCLLYFPPFLARYGHYIEDNYFLAVLSRMECGQVPYRDFEFLYGPIMIYPLHYWTALFGFSMQSYYAFLAILQGALFAAVIAVLQIYLPDWRRRFLAFALLLPALFDTLLGLNWIGWRRMLPIFAILMVAARPRDARTIVAAGTILGIQTAYSHEYGIVGLAAALSIYAALFLAADRWRIFLSACGLAGSTILVWLIASIALTGDTFLDYLTSTIHVLERAENLGLGRFEFHWTLHTLTLFAIISAAVVAVGSGLFQLRRKQMAEGDRLIFGMLIFAVLSMKIGLQRADIWHMSGPALGLILAFLLGAEQRLFVMNRSWNPAVWLLIVITAVTNGIGIMPNGSAYASGLARGGYDVLTGTPPNGPIDSRQFSVESERTQARGDITALAQFMASKENLARPVLFYGDLWWMGYHVGVCSSGYAFFDLMYSDGIQPMRNLVTENPDTLVVMSSDSYVQLFEGKIESRSPAELSITKRIGTWLSTVHYSQVHLEREIEFDIWKSNLGSQLTEEYERTISFGELVVLSRR